MTGRPKRANHRIMEQAKSGTARAALLGVSDGLVTNVSLILGVAGAGASSEIVRVAGFASLVAGALSMAVGEYISMRGQVELLQGILKAERDELKRNPDAAHSALEDILMNDGLTKESAHSAAIEIGKKPEKAMAVYARGKLGINPDELGSVWGSAFSSLIMFSLGAFVPLLPWLFLDGTVAVVLSLLLAIIGALTIGAYLGYTTGGRLARPAMRQLIVLIIAATITYVVGRIFGTQLT